MQNNTIEKTLLVLVLIAPSIMAIAPAYAEIETSLSVLRSLAGQAATNDSPFNLDLSKTYIPDFREGTRVYLDPKLPNSKVPFKFSNNFSTKLKTLRNVDVYVVAAQQGNELISADKKLGVAKVDELISKWSGVAKVDELISKWSGVPNFEKDKYVVIFWVRRSDDPSKGSVGVNVGSDLKQAGITPELLNSPEGSVMPSLRTYMPSDPEAALLVIASKISEQYQDLVNARQDREQMSVNLRSAGTWIVSILGLVLGGVATTGLVLSCKDTRKKTERRANTLVSTWSTTLENASALYLELAENQIPKLDLVEWEKADEAFQSRYQAAIAELAGFSALNTKGNELLEQAKDLIANKQFAAVSPFLNKAEIEVTGAAIPLQVANLMTGQFNTIQVDGKDLLRVMNRSYEKARDEILGLLRAYDTAIAFQDDKRVNLEYRQQLVAETNPLMPFNLKLAFGEFTEGKNIEIPKELQKSLQSIRTAYECALSASEKFNLTQLSDCLDQISQTSASVKDKWDIHVSQYESCSPASQKLVEQYDKLQTLFSEVDQVKDEVHRNFPSYPLGVADKDIHLAQIAIAQKEDTYAKLSELYLNQKFDEFFLSLKTTQQYLRELIKALESVLELPQTIVSEQLKYQSNIDRFRSRASDVDYSSDWELLNQALMVGNFVQLEQRINSLEMELEQVEREKEESDRQTRESYSLAGSSSSFWDSSSSSSSDSSSSWSSGGSDYGGSGSSDWSSGGSDYGSSSGGGDY
jgi:hypothetical protein